MLDKIIKFSITNKFLIGLLTLLLIVWGIWSALRLPIDAVPDITNNQIQIYTVCPTLASQEVEQLVTFPIEQSIANLPDLEEVRSISRFGLSVITVVFKDEVDIYFARQIVNEKIAEAKENIPAGIGSPELSPVSTGLGEVYQYILHPKPGSEQLYSSMDLRTMQDWIVARQLNGTEGVAEIVSFGGKLKQYEVAINPYRLKAMGVSITDIFTALERNNQNTGGAYIDKKPDAYFIRGVGLVTSIEDINNIMVKSDNKSVPIFIRDIAEVRYGHAFRYGAMTYNGEVDAVGGVVMMLKGENSHDVVQRIKSKIPIIQKSLPEDVLIEPYLDRTDLIERAIHTVEKNLIEGALIVILVLVLFLGNLRAGMIVASAIPLSMLFALGMMNVFNVSANLMSLGAIDFGLIVDGAVIIVEATLHQLGLRTKMGKLSQTEMDEEVFQSSSKIRNSAAFGEIIILIVYIPILTLIGIEGKMFRPMAMTVGFAILGALILSLTYIPMMCALFLPKVIDTRKTISDKLMNFFHQLYQPALIRALRIKYLLVGLTLVLFVFSLFLFSRLGGEFIPTLEEGDFAFHCILPQGSSLSQSVETSMQASKIIKQFDEVKMVVGKTGSAEVPTDPMPPEATDMMIILKPTDEWTSGRSYNQLANDIMHELEIIPGIFFEINQPIQMRFNELMTGIRQDVAVKVFGENMDTLLHYAQKIGVIVKGVEGASTPSVERVEGLPQINIEYDRLRIANYGLHIEDVNYIVSTAFAGKSTGVVYENERKFDLVVRLDSMYRTGIEDVSNLMIPTKNGNQIPLSQVASITYKVGPAQISREAGKRRIVVGFNVAGRDVQSVVQDIQLALDKQIKLPTGYYYTYGGTFENLQKASQRLMVAVPISLMLIFLLLFLTFNSLKEAGLIFTAIPMSAIGGVLALYFRDLPFSISAGIGFIALFGVSVLNGIVLIGTFNQLEKEGYNDTVKRILEGTKIRLRPVLMTATVASLGFLPMALSKGAGAEVQRPLATVVIGGLVTATFLTLFLLPLLYLIINQQFKRPKMNNTAFVSLILLVTLLVIPSFYGNVLQSQPLRIISSEQAVEIALKNNSLIKAREQEIAASTAMKKSRMEIPKADISLQFGQYNSIESDNGFAITQRLPFPSLFSAKSNYWNAESELGSINKAVSVNEIEMEVLSLYHHLLFLDAKRDKIEFLDSLYVDFVHIATLRYKTGDSKMSEQINAENSLAKLQLLARQNETDIQNDYTLLKYWLNVDEDLEIASNIEFVPLILEPLVNEDVVNDNPSLQAEYKAAELYLFNRKIARAEAMPDFNVGYNNISMIGIQKVDNSEVFYDRSKRYQYFNVGIGIPLSIGAYRAKSKSLGLKNKAQLSVADNYKSKLNAQLEILKNNYNQALEAYNYYKNIAIPNNRRIVNAANLGYKTGDTEYVEYLLALQMATSAELEYLDIIHNLSVAVVQIHSLINKSVK